MGFFSGLARLAGKVVSGVTKVATAVAPITSFVPGPVGIASRAFAAGSGLAGSIASARAPAMFNPSSLPSLPLSLPRGGAPSLSPAQFWSPGAEGRQAFIQNRGQCPPGWHLNKADGKYGAAGTYCVRNRSMNPTNHKAAMRAARRLIRFRKAVVRTEKALRKAVPPSARRRSPSGHRARLTHS